MSCRTDLWKDFVSRASYEQTVAEEKLSSAISLGLVLLDTIAGTDAFSFSLSCAGTPCYA
jgi:hypothetical protein